MLEMVFIIVIIGILSAAIIPRMDRDTLYEASEQLMSHIKYTQHLAMIDNVYDDTDVNWYQHKWKITFSGNQYTISKSQTGTFTDHTTIAKDPSSGLEIDGTNGVNGNDYDLKDKYNVTMNLSGVLSFDHLGRPYTGNATTLLTSDYNITLSEGSDSATITVTPETGYSYITFN